MPTLRRMTGALPVPLEARVPLEALEAYAWTNRAVWARMAALRDLPGACGPLAWHLHHWARGQGLKPALIHLHGYPRLRPDCAAARAFPDTERSGAGHVVVTWGGWLLDPAARQFDPAAPEIACAPLAELERALKARRDWQGWSSVAARTPRGVRVDPSWLAYPLPQEASWLIHAPPQRNRQHRHTHPITTPHRSPRERAAAGTGHDR